MLKIKLTALEHSSVLRKFTILFVLMSLSPIGVLLYFYLELYETGAIHLDEDIYLIVVSFLLVGAFLGYWIMRRTLRNIIEITAKNKKSLESLLGHEQVVDLLEETNEIKVLDQSFSEMTTRLEENIKNLHHSKRTLHSVLARVGRGISSLQEIDAFLGLIVETVTEALSAKTGVLMLKDDERNGFYFKSVYGFDSNLLNQSIISIKDGPFSQIYAAKKPFWITDSEGMPALGDTERILFETPILCSPLIWQDRLLGMIFVSGKKQNGKSFKKEEEVNLLYNLSLQTAVAIENTRLNSDAEKTYFETISALALAVEAKDYYSRGHLERVADYCIRIARKLNLPEEDIRILRDGARLHDLGKIGILDEILKKPSSLSPQEWEMMKKHTEIGEGIIKPIRSLSTLCDVIRHHHEKYDGTGYPDGLKGEEISVLARILSVADIFDALTTDRPYRKAFSFDEAKQELVKMKGKLDPKIVDVFLETI